MAGRKTASLSGDTYPVVEKLAEGILALARQLNPIAEFGQRRRKHRQMLDLLATKPEFRAHYLDLVTFFAVEVGNPTPDEWNHTWIKVVRSLAQAIVGTPPGSPNANAFLHWPTLEPSDEVAGARHRDNLFRYPAADPRVQIRVGSIHSVKGETHTATLVLDTYYHGHNLSTLKPWLLGTKAGRGTEGIRNLARLKQHYVAMTRPTHLICLAMREDALTSTDIIALKRRTWRIARVGDVTTEWL